MSEMQISSILISSLKIEAPFGPPIISSSLVKNIALVLSKADFQSCSEVKLQNVSEKGE